MKKDVLFAKKNLPFFTQQVKFIFDKETNKIFKYFKL